MQTTAFTATAALLGLSTVAATGLLLLAAIGSGSVLVWFRPVLPLTLAVGVALSARRARRRGEQESAAELLGWGAFANAILAGLL